MISDRAVHDIPDRVWPPDYEAVFDAGLARLRQQEAGGKPDSMLEADRLFAHTAVDLAGGEFDLMLLYLRGVDISCHFHWRAFEPAAFPDLDTGGLAAEREIIAREYELVDRTLGKLLSNAGPDVNVLVMSDHGFDAMDGETTHIRLKFDVVLEHLGFLTRTGSGVDFSRSPLYSYASPERSLVKKIRFALAGREEGGRVAHSDRTAIRNRLEAALKAVSFRGGSPAFVVRDAAAKETQRGADFIVEVLTEGAKKPLKVDGVPLRGAIRSIDRLSGTHGRKTPGIFIAAGPDIDARANLVNPRVICVPPTVLRAIGLPVAADFAGQTMTEIFTDAFLESHPAHRTPTWGEPISGENRASAVDEELVDQLRALGYLD
jgi:predicted AlkP superfamily phosphohydrolase/phosphomutase